MVSVTLAAAIFALLTNRHWVPGGDSEVYLATARNLLKAHFSFRRGYIFNGQPMNMVPPGWPYVLAMAMSISTKFAFLKLIVLLSMLGSLALAYPICRRFAPPLVAGAVVVLTALLSHVFPLTFWLHSDALFCLLGSASFLLAIQIGEGRTQLWRIALLGILCSCAVTVRWAGLLNWIVVAAALMDRQGAAIGRRLLTADYWRGAPSRVSRSIADPHVRRVVIALLLSFVATVGTFGIWRVALRVTAQEATLIREAGGAEESGLDPRADSMTHTEYTLMNANDAGVARLCGPRAVLGRLVQFSLLATVPFPRDQIVEYSLRRRWLGGNHPALVPRLSRARRKTMDLAGGRVLLVSSGDELAAPQRAIPGSDRISFAYEHLGGIGGYCAGLARRRDHA